MTDRDRPASEFWPSVVYRFLANVERTPDEIAIRSPDSSLAWRELDALSNRVANTIPRSADRLPVLVLCEDEVDYLVAKLGVLKVGRPVVPMHPAEPEARMAMIAEQSQADTVIVSRGQRLPEGLVGGAEIRMNVLSADENAPGTTITPTDTALLTFTSGSTGVPKGVVHSHRSVLLRSEAYGRALGMSAADRVILLSRESDLDFMAALILGASSFPFDIRVRGVADLPGWVRGWGVTLFRSTPSVLRVFVAQTAGLRLPELRLVASGGETLFPHDLEVFRSVFDPQTELLQIYGSAEAGLVTTQRIDNSFDAATDELPIGLPVPGVHVELIDSDGGVPTTGAPGVMVVTSAWLASGYLNHGELTAERFRGSGDDRQFVSGDLGRYDDRGRLIFLGRADDLVKVRGHRIEIGEVEVALRRVPGIVEAVVVPRSDAVGATTLVGYYTTVESGDLRVSDIRAELARYLPAFMIPSVWVRIDAFPISGIGKIDRKALPPPPEGARLPPAIGRDLVDRMIALWRDLLGVGEIGVDDSFFDLGGDSLAAAALMAAVEDEFGCRIPMADLFELETLGDMCAQVMSAGPESRASLLVPLKRSGNLQPLYCIYLPGWPEALYWSLSRHMDRRRPVTGVVEDLSVEHPPESRFTDIATRYATAIRRDSDGPYHLLGTSAGGILAYEIGRTLVESGAEVGFVGLIDSGYPGVRLNARERVGRGIRRIRNAAWRYGVRGVVSLAISRTVGADARQHAVRTRLLKTYRYHRIQPSSLPVTYFRATHDKAVPASLAGWRALGARIVDVAGTHTGPDSTLHERNAPGLARALESAIAASTRSGRSVRLQE